MRVLSVRQPWASCIAWLDKRVENRSTNWSYRGLLAIQASRHDSTWTEHASAGHAVRAADASALSLVAQPAGFVVAVTELTDVHRTEPGCCASPWADPAAAVHLVLGNTVGLRDLVPSRGRLGLWEPSDDLRAAIESALAAA